MSPRLTTPDAAAPSLDCQPHARHNGGQQNGRGPSCPSSHRSVAGQRVASSVRDTGTGRQGQTGPLTPTPWETCPLKVKGQERVRRQSRRVLFSRTQSPGRALATCSQLEEGEFPLKNQVKHQVDTWPHFSAGSKQRRDLPGQPPRAPPSSL